jgi:5-methylcytosine-specific restriction protein A
MDLVASKEDIAANLAVFDGYRTAASIEHRDYFANRLRLGKQFVWSKVGDRFLFAPSRFAGYKDCTFEKHSAFPLKDGKITTPAINRLLKRPVPDEAAEAAYVALCGEAGVSPSAKPREYWHLILPAALFQLRTPAGESGYPDEVAVFVEGATRRVFVNAYERNPKVREACLAHYGVDCSVCGFNFGLDFGAIGDGFMHVHHLNPISSFEGSHEVDPIADLRPVCPNCHAMLHRSDPPFSIQEMREIRAAAKDA